MYLQANTMTGAMNIVLGQTSYLQSITRQSISSQSRHTRVETSFAGFHSIEHSIIDFLHTWLIWFAETDGTSHVGTVALVACAHINGDELTSLNLAFARLSMRH